MDITRTSLPTRAMLVIAAVELLWLISLGPISDASAPAKMRAAIVVFALLALVVTPSRHRITYTTLVWIALGASAGFGLLTLVSAGPLALVPLICMVVYTIAHSDEMASEATLIGVVVASVMFLLMIPFV